MADQHSADVITKLSLVLREGDGESEREKNRQRYRERERKERREREREAKREGELLGREIDPSKQ